MPKKDTSTDVEEKAKTEVVETDLAKNAGKEKDSTKKPKKKKWKLIIALSIIAVLLIASGVTSFMIKRNPSSVFKSAINKGYKDFSKELNDLDDAIKDLQKELDYEGARVYDMNISFKGGTFKDLESSSINLKLGLDNKDKKVEISGELKDDGKILADGAAFIKDDTAYLYSDSILNGGVIVKEDIDDFIAENIGFSLKNASVSDIVDGLVDNDVLNTDIDEETADKIKYFTDKKLTEIFDKKLIDKIAKDGKNALIKSINKDNLEKTEETIEINDLSVNTYKYTYVINESSLKDFMKTFSETLKNDKDFIDNVAKLTGVDKKDIKDLLNELGDKDNYENVPKAEFSIYTTKTLLTPVRYELVIDNFVVSYSEYKKNFSLLLAPTKGNEKIELSGVPNGKTTDVKLEYNINKNKGTILEGTINKNDKKEKNFEFTMNTESISKLSNSSDDIPSMKIKYSYRWNKKESYSKIDFGDLYSMTSETKFESDDKTTGQEIIDLNLTKDNAKSFGIDLSDIGLDEITGKIIIDITYTKGGTIADYNVNDADNINDLEDDYEQKVKENVESFMNDFKESNMFKFFSNLNIKIPTDTSSNSSNSNDNNSDLSIYDDDDCFDAYLDNDNYNSYVDYYNDYCR